jgi:hypothetical protein
METLVQLFDYEVGSWIEKKWTLLIGKKSSTSVLDSSIEVENVLFVYLNGLA